MARRKSVKKLLEPGIIIQIGENQFYIVTGLKENTFQCRKVNLIGTDLDYIQDFNYNIEMVLFKRVADNIFNSL